MKRSKGKMRLIRSVLRPAYISSFHQLRWRQVLKTSNESLNPVIFRTDHGSNVQCVRGRSFAASVPSDTPKRKKDGFGRRVPKHERRFMVEDYVNKYRAMNAGKFPTTSDTKRDVGGSYYVIRDILEELKYNSKTSSSEKMNSTSSQNNDTEKVEISNKCVKVSPQSQEMVEAINHAENISSTQITKDEGPCNVQQNSGVLLRKDKKRGISLSKGEGTLSTQVVVDGPISISKSPQSNEGPRSSILFKENDEAKLPVSDVSKDAETQSRQFDGQQPMAGQQQSIDSDISERELDKVPAEYSAEKKSSLWQNLKSFANGIFDMWRR